MSTLKAHDLVRDAEFQEQQENWREAIRLRREAAGLFSHAMIETTDDNIRMSLRQISDAQERRAREIEVHLDLITKHEQRSIPRSDPRPIARPRSSSAVHSNNPFSLPTSSSSPIREFSPTSPTSPSTSLPSGHSFSPNASSFASSSSFSSSPNQSASVFSASPVTSLWVGVEKLLENFLPSSIIGSSSSPKATHSSSIIDSEILGGGFDPAPAPRPQLIDPSSLPHYTIPRASSKKSVPTITPSMLISEYDPSQMKKSESDKEMESKAATSSVPRQPSQDLDSLTNSMVLTPLDDDISPSSHHKECLPNGVIPHDDGLSSLEKEQLIGEVRALRAEVATLTSLLQSSADIRHENETLKRSIFQFREEVKNLSHTMNPSYPSCSIPASTSSSSSAGAQFSQVRAYQELVKENEALKKRLKESELRIASYRHKLEKMKREEHYKS